MDNNKDVKKIHDVVRKICEKEGLKYGRKMCVVNFDQKGIMMVTFNKKKISQGKDAEKYIKQIQYEISKVTHRNIHDYASCMESYIVWYV